MALYCKKHNVKCIWKEGGTRKDGTTYKGFYACPEKDGNDYCKGEKIDEADWIAEHGEQANSDSPAKVEKSVDWDRKDRKIQYQHSQEMAIRALELEAKLHPEQLATEAEKKGLVGLIDLYTDIFMAKVEAVK